MFDELTIMYCKAGKQTAEKIKSSLEALCERKKIELEEEATKVKRMTPHRRRSLEFVKDIASFGLNVRSNCTTNYKDGELKPVIEYNVRGHDVYIVQNTLEPHNPDSLHTNMWELILTIDALQRAGAGRVSAILPYLSYSKQDRKQGREPISCAVYLNILQERGLKQLVTMDLHNAAVEGAANPEKMIIENLFASSLLIEHTQKYMGPEDIYLAPDPSAGKKVQHYSKVTGREMALAYKYRDIRQPHKVAVHKLLGEVRGRGVVQIDDQTATADTICSIGEQAMMNGALFVDAGVTHGPLVEAAEKKLQESVQKGYLRNLCTTDTLPLQPAFLSRNEFIIYLSNSAFFARSIYELHTEGSLKKLYNPFLQKELFGLQNGAP